MSEEKRQRRTAEEARRLILDAAAKRLAESGPDGIRLQQLAADVGISHPAVLHHFGTRDALIEQVVRRAADSLHAELIESLQQVTEDEELAVQDVMERAARTLVDSGHGRVVGWLSLAGFPIGADVPRLRAVAEVAYARRRERGDDCSLEDVIFQTLLVSLVLFGEAIVGSAMRTSAGLPDTPETQRRFRDWLVRLLTERQDA